MQFLGNVNPPPPWPQKLPMLPPLLSNRASATKPFSPPSQHLPALGSRLPALNSTLHVPPGTGLDCKSCNSCNSPENGRRALHAVVLSNLGSTATSWCTLTCSPSEQEAVTAYERHCLACMSGNQAMMLQVYSCQRPLQPHEACGPLAFLVAEVHSISELQRPLSSACLPCTYQVGFLLTWPTP